MRPTRPHLTPSDSEVARILEVSVDDLLHGIKSSSSAPAPASGDDKTANKAAADPSPSVKR